jgi:hypothetical protein
MKGSKTLFFSSKAPWARQRISSKFTDSLGTRPQKCSPVLPYAMTQLSLYVDQATCWTTGKSEFSCRQYQQIPIVSKCPDRLYSPNGLLAAFPPGKTRYPLYRRLGGHHGRSGWVGKISPPRGFDPGPSNP